MATDTSDIERQRQPSFVKENFSGPTALALILICLVLAVIFMTVATMSS